MAHMAIRCVFFGMRVPSTTMSSRRRTDTLDPLRTFSALTNMHSKGYLSSVGTLSSSAESDENPCPGLVSRVDIAEDRLTGALSPMTVAASSYGSGTSSLDDALMMLSFTASPRLTVASVLS